MKQASFFSLAYDNKKNTTRREVFLSEVDAVIPWEVVIKLVNG